MTSQLNSSGKRLRAVRAFCAASRHDFCKKTRFVSNSYFEIAILHERIRHFYFNLRFCGFAIFCENMNILQNKSGKVCRSPFLGTPDTITSDIIGIAVVEIFVDKMLAAGFSR